MKQKLRCNSTIQILVVIFDLGTAKDDAYFIAMEYVSGHDVRAVFDRLNETKKALSIEIARHIVKEV